MRTAKVQQVMQTEYKDRYMIVNTEILSGIQPSAFVRACGKLCSAVVFDEDAWPEDMRNILITILKETKCKIIVASSKPDLPFKIEISSYAEVRDEWSLAQLAEQAQARFLDKSILFQGQSVKLSQLQAAWPRLPQAMDGPMLCALAAGRPVSVGEAPPGPDPGQPYIPRTLEHRTALRPELLRLRAPSEHLVLSGFPPDRVREWLGADPRRERGDIVTAISIRSDAMKNLLISGFSQHTRQYLERNGLKEKELHDLKGITLLPYTDVGTQKLEEDKTIFSEVCNKFKTQNIHWLEYKSGHIFWRETSGERTLVLKHVCKLEDGCFREGISETCLLNERDIANWQSRVIHITGEPGMGKTAFINELACRIKTSNPTTTVVCVKLDQHGNNLQKIPEKNITINEAITLLLHSEKRGEFSKFYTENIRDCINGSGRIVVLFDDIDEFSIQNKNCMLSILGILLKTKVSQIWVVSQPAKESEVQNVQACTSLNLRKFTYKDQIKYISCMLSENSKPGPKVEFTHQGEKSVDIYLKDLELRNKNILEILDVPLHMFMLAKLWQEKSTEENALDSMDILKLYDYFVDMKYGVARRKRGLREEQLEDPFFLEAEISDRILHQKCAIYILTNDALRKDVENKSNLLTSDKTGLVQEMEEKGWKFFHESFACYFAALFLCEEREVHKELIRIYVYVSTNALVREFFDRKLARGKPLHESVINGTEDAVRAGLADAGSTDEGGREPLHLAAVYGRTGIAQLLLEAGAGVGALDGLLGWTPLRYACATEQWETAELLLQNGASGGDLNARLRERGYEAVLQRAVRAGLYNVVKAIVDEFGESVHIRDERSLTPLHAASIHGRTEICNLLLERGADIAARTDEECAPLHLAAGKGRLETAELLLQHGANVNVVGEQNITPLHVAVHEGHTNICRLLLDHGADIAARTDKGYAPLYMAAGNGRLKVAELLLQHRADVNVVNVENWTPLHLAAQKGHTGMCRLLLEYGANIAARAINGSEPLHAAAQQGNSHTAELLISRGASVNSANSAGVTPLHTAAGSNSIDTCRLLVARGADLTARDWAGNQPLVWALRRGAADCAELLLQLMLQ